MNDIEVSSIDLVEGGNVFKQGHYLTLGYVPRDENGETVDLSGKTLNVALWGRKGVVFEAPATFSGGVIRFTLDKTVPAAEDYTVEFTATSSTDAKYRKKFPANSNAARIAIKQSADDLGVIGISVYTIEKFEKKQKEIQDAYQSTVDSKVLELETEFDAAVSAVTVDSEVVIARGNEPTLNQRLQRDAAVIDTRLNETTLQLADKVGMEALEYKDVKSQRDFVSEFQKMSSFKKTMSLEKIYTSLDSLRINIPLSNADGITYTFQENPNDDFLLLLNGDYGTLENTLGVIQKTNYSTANLGDGLNVDHVMNPPNYYTIKVGATISHDNLYGTEIRFASYADNRGGIWEFTLNAGTPSEQKKTISVFSATAVTIKEQVLFSGLDLKAHKINGVFKGADPANAPTGGTARGWLYFGGTRDQDTSRTFQVYANRTSVKTVTKALYGYSVKEFAVRLRPNGSTEPYRYVPEHDAIGTAFAKEPRKVLVDGKEINMANFDYADGFETLQIIQRVYGFHPSQPTVPMLEIFNQHTIKEGAVSITGKIKFLQDADVASASSILTAYQADVFKKIKSSTGNEYDVISSGTYSIENWAESDKFKSLAFLNNDPASANKDVALAMTVDNLDLSYRYGEEGRGTPFSWIEHRSATLGKIYNRPMKETIVQAGEEFVFGGRFIVTKIPGISEYVL